MADTGSLPRDARRFDGAGVRDLPALVGLGTALDLLRTIGPGEVETRVRYLAGRLRLDAGNIPGIRGLTASDPELAAGVTALGLEDADAAEVAAALRQRFGISVQACRALRLNAIAVSTHHYNTPEEIDRLLDGLRKVI
jgi:selenocysteine lyase/cysteine desulfurase